MGISISSRLHQPLGPVRAVEYEVNAPDPKNKKKKYDMVSRMKAAVSGARILGHVVAF